MKKIVKLLYNNMSKYFTYRGEKKNIKRKKNLINKVTLSKEQIEKVDNLWVKNYGKKVPKDWHKLYTSYLGIFDEKYFPEIFFTTNLLNKLNPIIRKKYLDDKILTECFFKNIDYIGYKLPQNYIYNCNEYFYDNERYY